MNPSTTNFDAQGREQRGSIRPLERHNVRMKNGACAAFLFDGFADHELSLVMAALHRTGSSTLETFSTKGRTVTAASGLMVQPHTNLSTMNPEDFDLLLLPGGDQWEKGDNLEIFPLIQATVGRRPVVAIGSAILSLADLGLLDHIPHTGCHPGYFSGYCPEYAGADYFCRQSCVNAGGIITIDSSSLVDAASSVQLWTLFDTLQEITAHSHELHDPAY